MKNFWKIVLPPVALIAGAGVVMLMFRTRQEVKPAPREVALPLVRAVPAKAEVHRFKVRSQGSVSPRTDIQLVSEVAGRVIAVAPSFEAGGFFEADEALVRLDPRDFELAVTRARAGLADAGVQLQREEAEAEVARKEWASLGDGASANPLLLREPQLAEARARVESSKASLAEAQLNLERCTLKAPFAGRVWTRKVGVGQFINKGEAVARLYAVDYAEVRLPIPLEDLAFLDLPMEYRGEARSTRLPRVILSARVGGESFSWEGSIVRTEGEIDPRTRMLGAVARVENPYGRGGASTRPPLSVGLFVEAEIEGREAGQVLVAPRAALRPDERLAVVDREERLRFRPIELLRMENDRVIFRGGLEEGDLVTLSPLSAPVDGMRVRINRPEESVSAPATPPAPTAGSVVR